MSNLDSLKLEIDAFLRAYGLRGYRIARSKVLKDKRIESPIRQVLKFLIEECWPDVQHPALIAMACEAVGGKPEAPDEVSAGIVLLAGAADMHDDIVDKSKIKGTSPTAYAKFGADLVLIAGDILLLKAATQVNDACEDYPIKTRRSIRHLVEDSFFELGIATAAERSFKGKLDVDPNQYREIIEAKGAVSEACARIGGIIGQAKPPQIEALGQFGRALGVLMTLRHEFKDIGNPVELRNRLRNEVLPLPLYYAFQDEIAKEKILNLLNGRIFKKEAEQIAFIAMSTKGVQGLKAEIGAIAKNCEEGCFKKLIANIEPFKLLLKLAVQDL
jgi:geranylgeranyl pyrophosphate synthase